MQEFIHKSVLCRNYCTMSVRMERERERRGTQTKKKGGRRIRTAAGNRVSFVNQKDLLSRAPWI